MTLDEATGKLEAILLNPCACDVCKHAARLAREALMQVSPLADELMAFADRTTPEFQRVEKWFREQELERMISTLDCIARGRCMMLTPTKVEHTAPQIPSLPYQQGLSVAIERYRKYSARRRIEMKPKPRIPGTYVIK